MKNTAEKECYRSLLDEPAEMVVEKQLLSVENNLSNKLAWRAFEMREHFRALWKNDGFLLREIYPLFSCEASFYKRSSTCL